MKKFAFPLFFALLFAGARAQSPTWSGDVACLLYTHCTSCHNPNGIAPFSLTTYSDAYSHLSLISIDVNQHIMPPYSPNVTYQQYIGERYLSDGEMNLLNAWIAADGPSGDTTQAPATPVYSSGAVITNPGFTARIPTFTIPQISTDLYRCFIVSNPFPQPVYVSGIEIIPGNNAAVHHVVIFQDTSSIPVQLDSAALPGPGYTEFGSDGSHSGQLVGVWAPGAPPYFTPPGMAIEIAAGARIILQIHYPAGTSGLVDSTRINLQYSTEPSPRLVYINYVLNYFSSMVNGPLSIPANTIDTFYEKYTLPAKVTVLAVAPHAHLICNYMKSFAVEPGGDTIPFISDAWNFHWQGFYPFKKPIVVPNGTVLWGQAIYNNTDNNTSNPNTPPELVSSGEATTDEMMLFFFAYTLYQAGDENAVYDTTTYIHSYDNCAYAPVTSGIIKVPQLQAELYPNPSTGLLEVNLAGATECTAAINDVMGNSVMLARLHAGNNMLDISPFAAGMYFITFTDDSGNLKPQTLRVVKQ